MKKLIFLIIVAMLLLPSITLADGGMVYPPYQSITLPEQKAVVAWDDGKETLIVSTKIKTDNITDMAWIIPIKSKVKPEIEV